MSDFGTLVDEIETAMADSTIAFHKLRLSQAHQASARRVIWIPTTFNNGGVMTSNPQVNDAGERVHTLCTDMQTVEAHIIGETFDDVCAIRAKVLNAVRVALQTGSKPAGGEYVTQLEHGAANMFGGREKILQRFMWTMNVVREVEQVTAITAVDQDNALNDEVESTLHIPGQ
jgi:hypothetical protein